MSLTEAEHAALLERVRTNWDLAHDGLHAKCRDRWENLYGLYAQFTEWRNSRPVDDRSRDVGLREAKREWGAELFIPYSFSIVETILSRMLSRSPRVIVKPDRPEYEHNADSMKHIIDKQLADMDYELRLQRVARTGLKLGLGVQKTFWNSTSREGRRLAPATIPQPGREWMVEEETKTTDDPLCIWVDPFDFLWDPFAATIADCEWAFHRMWRSPEYAKRMVESGKWVGIEPVDLEGSGGSAKFSEAHAGRDRSDGWPNKRAVDRHEVWEYHTGAEVVTVVDRQWIVQVAPNPAWHGELPFQVYRPTPRDGRLDGIGEIEPIVDLQLEMNTLRSQRRDNATIALQQSFFYAEGLIDPADFKIGPGRGVPVLGNPSEAFAPIPFRDIPNSGYTEEQRLQSDIERATGVDDSLAGSGNTQQTATGVQLVQAAANLRIQQKTRNCEVELVRGAGRQILALNQLKILTDRTVAVPSPPTPGQPDRRWTWREVSPGDLQGEMTLDIEGGSMAPENIPQQRQDAQMMLALSQSPLGERLDPDRVSEYVLHNAGVKEPTRWIRRDDGPPMVPARALELLEGAGVDPALLKQAVMAARQENSDG